MGYRIVVMLSMNEAHEWGTDKLLGKKILSAQYRDKNIGRYGRVVQTIHSDVQTLAVLDGYETFTEVGNSNYGQNETDEEMHLKLLQKFADSLGYTLRKK